MFRFARWWGQPRNRYRTHRAIKIVCLVCVPVAGWIAVWEDWTFKVITVVLAALSVMYGAWALERIEKYRIKHPDEPSDRELDGE